MARLVDGLIAEIEQEADGTRRLLERVPHDKLDWKPHPKSMTLGQLALHVARIPGAIAQLLESDSLNADEVDFTPDQPGAATELLPALDAAIAQAQARLDGWTDEDAGTDWTLLSGGKPLFTTPRIAVVRSLMLNHWYHHRGQLTIYLRLLDVDLPATYGRSADENPLRGS